MTESGTQSDQRIQLQPPQAFSFIAEQWSAWKRRWERFRTASGLHHQPDTDQINSLIYIMGDKAEDVLTALCLTTANAKKYAKVIEAFDSHFVVKKNITYERALFNRRIQDEGEAMTDFITALRTLVERCDYGDLKDELIRDKIVVGMRDQKLSTKLQLEQDLTLEKAECERHFKEEYLRTTTKYTDCDGHTIEVKMKLTRLMLDAVLTIFPNRLDYLSDTHQSREEPEIKKNRRQDEQLQKAIEESVLAQKKELDENKLTCLDDIKSRLHLLQATYWDASDTARFIRVSDHLFDILNSRNHLSKLFKAPQLKQSEA
ncbi:hypothetical protein MTO96_018573 [Rhipicephalus appendiculatus]